MGALSTLAKPAQWLMDFFNGTVNGKGSKAITANDIISTSSAWYAVNKIAGHVGQLPVNVKKRTEAGSENDRTHSGSRLMRIEPNRFQLPIIFRETVQSHALLWGNGRSYIRRNPINGDPLELIPLMPDRTDTFMYRGEKWHITQPKNDDRLCLFEDLNEHNTVVMHDDDVHHIPGFGFDGVKGKSLMSIAKESFTVGIEADKRSAKQMAKGFNGQLMLEDSLGRLRNREDAKKFLESFEKHHDADQEGKQVGLLLEGMKANVLSMSNKDAEFLASRQNQREETALWFCIESILGDNSSSYNGLEQKNLAYLSGCLARWLIKWEQESNRKLLTESQRMNETHYFKFNTAALLRTDMQTTVNTIGNAIASRLMNPNEGRALLDMNSYEGGDAFENPNITPGETKTEEPAPADNTPTASAKIQRLEHMLGVEQKRVQSFIDSGKSIEHITAWYESWAITLGDVIESELGGSRAIADEHCKQNVEYLSKGRKVFDLTGTAELLINQIEGE